MTSKQNLKVTLLKSTAKCIEAHKASVRGLGLRRRHHSVLVANTPENRGMVNRVRYLLSVEEV